LSATGQTLYSAQFSYSGGLLSQASVVSATASGSVSYTDSYLYGGDGQPIEFTRVQNGATNDYWYEYDGRGDVVSVTDSNGNVVDSYEYDMWGEELTDTSHEALPQRLRAGAMWYDAEMQVQWLWDASTNRYYDPELERYLQPDAPGGSYAFAGDDPVDNSDVSSGVSGLALGPMPHDIGNSDEGGAVGEEGFEPDPIPLRPPYVTDEDVQQTIDDSNPRGKGIYKYTAPNATRALTGPQGTTRVRVAGPNAPDADITFYRDREVLLRREAKSISSFKQFGYELSQGAKQASYGEGVSYRKVGGYAAARAAA